MSPTVAALLGSLIGALAALIGATVNNVVSVRTERRRMQFAKDLADVETLRERSGAAFAELLGVLQEVEWISWFGTHDPAALTEARIAAYDTDIHTGYRRLLGAMAMTASVSLPVYNELKTYLDQLYGLESDVALALRQVVTDPTGAGAT